jgi:coatomer subunit beta'
MNASSRSTLQFENQPLILLAALYSGNVMIWDYESGSLAKNPLKSVNCRSMRLQFVERKQWFIAASDDMRLHVFSTTRWKIKEFEGTPITFGVYIVHPLCLTCCLVRTDMTIEAVGLGSRFWCTKCSGTRITSGSQNQSQGYQYLCVGEFGSQYPCGATEAHVPHYTRGHERGVNCIDYYPSGASLIFFPERMTGYRSKIWDYQVRRNMYCVFSGIPFHSTSFISCILTFSHPLFFYSNFENIATYLQTKSIVHSLDGHTHNVCAVLFHPSCPLSPQHPKTVPSASGRVPRTVPKRL